MAATSRMGVLLLLAACGGGNGRGAGSDTTGMAAVPAAEQPTTGGATGAADTAMTPAAAPATDSAAAAPSRDTAQAAASKAATSGAAKPAQDTAKKAPAKPAAGGAGGAQSPQQVALGDSIFHGQVAGGTCTACHGQDAKGTAVAPNLTDAQWINGDGSYDFIVKTVTNGVPQPKEHPAPMPPKGGAQLSDDQVKAVAAYVYSLGHKS
jgi:mono/diheme cytochrome c family protein